MTIYGYARISSDHSEFSLETQSEELKLNGAQIIITEVGLGRRKSSRPKLSKLIESLVPGDKLLVVKLDRFARNTYVALQQIHAIKQRGASFRSLDISHGLPPEQQELITNMMFVFAEFEVNNHRSHQLAGIQKAKEAGKFTGRKPHTATQKQIKLYLDLVQQDIPKDIIADRLRISRSTMHKYYCKVFTKTIYLNPDQANEESTLLGGNHAKKQTMAG